MNNITISNNKVNWRDNEAYRQYFKDYRQKKKQEMMNDGIIKPKKEIQSYEERMRKLSEYKKKYWTCETCKEQITNGCKYKHLKTQKHKNNLKIETT